ncbi:MAG: Hpt domain-containing protein [Roseburia sp.]|nr:Hpt domain-containing protein [Roseburia sp.]
MTVEQCYQAIDGDYEAATRRLMNDGMIEKFLSKFLADESYADLCQAFEEKDYPKAFKAAHSLKGVSQNMGFDPLSVPAVELTEELRDGQVSEKAFTLYESVKENYDRIKQVILEFQNSTP